MREYWGTFKSDTRLFMELSFSVSLSGLGQLNFFILKVSVIIWSLSIEVMDSQKIIIIKKGLRIFQFIVYFMCIYTCKWSGFSTGFLKFNVIKGDFIPK